MGWASWASCLHPAPRRCLVEGCCGSMRAGTAAGGAPTATSRLRGYSQGGSSRFPPAHDVSDQSSVTSLLLCYRELLDKALDSVTEEAGLWHGRIQKLYLLLLLHVSEIQPEMALLDNWRGHRTTQRLCGHLRHSKSEWKVPSTILWAPHALPGRMAPEGGRWKPAWPPSRNHSSSIEGSGRVGGFHTSPTFSAARESIAVISGSGSDNATTPKGGNLWRHRTQCRPGCQDECWITLEAEGLCHVWHSGIYYATPRWSCPHKKNMNHPRKLPQHAECPDTWGSDRDRPEAPGDDQTQKRTGDKTSLKRHDHPCCSFREIALLVLKYAGELDTAHSWCGCLHEDNLFYLSLQGHGKVFYVGGAVWGGGGWWVVNFCV